MKQLFDETNSWLNNLLQTKQLMKQAGDETSSW